LISGIPLLLGFTFYLFDFSWLKKLGLTALALLHLSLFVPLQYLLQAYLLNQFSLLFLPLFALVGGLPLDVMIVVAFYSWGMSWQERGSRRTLPRMAADRARADSSTPHSPRPTTAPEAWAVSPLGAQHSLPRPGAECGGPR
jgi:hypothetical protein